MIRKTITSLPENTASAICYTPFVGFIPAAVFLLVGSEKKVRWHAVQSLLTYGLYTAIYFVLVPILTVTIIFIPFALMIGGVAWVAFMILWLVLAVRTYQNQEMRLPYVGELADKLVRK